MTEGVRMKKATFIDYTPGSFIELPAMYGYLAFDPETKDVIMSWDWDESGADLLQAEMDLNEVGYTLGLEA